MTFENLGLMDSILDALHRQGYTAPTPIQAGAIPAVLQGRDVLGLAQTGTGKTCAFSAPILQRLAGRAVPGRPIRALIVTPTRELAIQIHESLTAYGANLPLRTAVIFGGVGQAPQVQALQRGVDILVATPGRLLDLHGQGLLHLDRLEILVLDEADRMLDMGFIHDVRRILKIVPAQKQTLFFSATMPPEITELVDSLLHNPVRVAVNPVSSPVELITQKLYYVDKANKLKLLCHLLQTEPIESMLVFSRTKHGANRIAEGLQKKGIGAAAIHGNKSQSARQKALADFKAGRIRVLVATDIAARGLDIASLPYVLNYDLPDVPETYVHRIGRTGRAGRDGTAIAFCETAELPELKQIEKLLKKPIEVVAEHPYPMQQPPAAAKAAAHAAVRHQSSKPSRPAAEKGGDTPTKTARIKPKDVRRKPDPQFASLHFDASPIEDRRRPDPLAGDRVMDATARLLAPRPRSVSRVTEPQPHKAPAKRAAAAKPEPHRAAEDGVPHKSRRRRRRSSHQD